jgi:hypothetical protein
MWTEIIEVLGCLSDWGGISTRDKPARSPPRGWPWAAAVLGVTVAGAGVSLAFWTGGPVRVGAGLILGGATVVVLAVVFDRLRTPRG